MCGAAKWAFSHADLVPIVEPRTKDLVTTPIEALRSLNTSNNTIQPLIDPHSLALCLSSSQQNNPWDEQGERWWKVLTTMPRESLSTSTRFSWLLSFCQTGDFETALDWIETVSGCDVMAIIGTNQLSQLEACKESAGLFVGSQANDWSFIKVGLVNNTKHSLQHLKYYWGYEVNLRVSNTHTARLLTAWQDVMEKCKICIPFLLFGHLKMITLTLEFLWMKFNSSIGWSLKACSEKWWGLPHKH